MEEQRPLGDVDLVFDLVGSDQLVAPVAWRFVPMPTKHFPGGVGGSGMAPDWILSRTLAATSEATDCPSGTTSTSPGAKVM